MLLDKDREQTPTVRMITRTLLHPSFWCSDRGQVGTTPIEAEGMGVTCAGVDTDGRLVGHMSSDAIEMLF
jgi:hypothetical protein